MSINLGFIELLDQNDADSTNTIIYGAHRYEWCIRHRPASVVTQMFEHWRPEKFLNRAQMENFLKSGEFSLFHAIKDETLVRKVFNRVPKSATTVLINYNNQEYLKEAIDSAIKQDRKNVV